MKSGPGESVIEHITRQWQDERPDLDLADFLLAIYLRRLGQLIESEYDRMCQARFGMSARDMRVLLALRRGGPPYALRPTDLFEALLVTSGAVTKQVDRLERRRLVKRLPDPDHGGGFRVQLTPRGLEMVDAAVDLLATSSPIKPATSRVDKRKREAAARFCLKLISILETAKEPAVAEGAPGKKARRAPRARS
ncbi:MAG: MarR family winged helix-turn-helix transcriptional regulator [Reyranella sp.]